MSSTVSLEDIRMGARFLWQLPALLRNSISLPEAHATLAHRLQNRDADFLATAKRAIYDNPQSPYSQLLDLAGCEYGDLEKLVLTEGLEATLQVLLRRGVYLTVDEFKGCRPVVVRGSAVVHIDPKHLESRVSGSYMTIQSGGSRSTGTPAPIDLAYIRDRAVSACLTFHARGGNWVHGIWGVPGGSAMAPLLEFSAFGARPARWFSQVDPLSPGLHPRYRWGVRAMRWGSLLTAASLPRPEYVPLEDPSPLVHWMEDVLRSGHNPHIHTHASCAVRLCRAAFEAGVDLTGAYFTAASEPTTAARLEIIRRSGALAWPQYASVESGSIGLGCLAPEVPDEVHLLTDRLALIQSLESGSNGLFLSSLRPTAAPFLLLNFSLGDTAVVSQRSCNCPLQQLGWTTHLQSVRSFEKLTAGGMTFLDTDVINILEQVLPAHFGGEPTDYQLVEEEAADGEPRLCLLVNPTLGDLNRDAVAEVFLTAISKGSGAERVMGLAWRNAKLLRVERRAPLSTASGKILHLHVRR
jgi:hypothetical protein